MEFRNMRSHVDLHAGQTRWSSTDGFDGEHNVKQTGIETVSDDNGYCQPSSSSSMEADTPSKKRGYWRGIQRYIWDDPKKPAHEKKFLFKLDVFLLSYTCLGYFCKNLDQSNINNAYVSGMKEALHMGGSELTYASNVFTAGYVVSQIPAVILVSRIRASYIIPAMEILWAVFTFCTAAVKTVDQLYAMRFLVGLCEGAYFPVIIYLISSWYKKDERGKRVTIFYSTATIAGMFSGYIQAAAYRNLDGTDGLKGWQWLYIICGVISLPVGIIGFFFLPDFPENTHAFYLRKEDIALARQRLLDDGYKPLGAAAWTRHKLLHIFASWQFWILSAGYFFVQSSFPSQQPNFALYLKSTHHSVYEINVWPTGQNAVGVVTQIAAGMLSDSPLLQGRRWQAITVMQGGTVFACTVLAVWNVPEGLKYTAYYLSYMAAGVPGIYYSWFPDLMPHDHEMRGFVTASSNIFSYVNQIWFSLTFWRTAFAPRFQMGFIAEATFGAVLIFTALLMRALERRDVGELQDVGVARLHSPSVETVLPAPTKLTDVHEGPVV